MPSVTRTLRHEFPGLTLELTIVDVPEGADGTVDLEVRRASLEDVFIQLQEQATKDFTGGRGA